MIGVVVLALLVGGCGGPPRVPTGVPIEVVRASPAITVAAGPAELFVSRATTVATGVIDLSAGTGPAALRAEAQRALDLLEERFESVRAYGGNQVRGISTLRYEVDLAEPAARIDVWIDVDGRVRRIQRPQGQLGATPTPTQPGNGLPDLIVVDFVF